MDVTLSQIHLNYNFSSQDVISPTPEVTVYHAHARGSSCVSEASFTFQNIGETDICFQSAYVHYYKESLEKSNVNSI